MRCPHPLGNQAPHFGAVPLSPAVWSPKKRSSRPIECATSRHPPASPPSDSGRPEATPRAARQAGARGTSREAEKLFERFTDRARRVVVLAQEEARLLNHNYIGTEHILLGLIHEG